jgi:deazaflavin-dependent oxidoreductase (nitroreductase family)
MTSKNVFMKIGNGTMKFLLRSPFHKLVSGNMMLVTVKGHKSGKAYTTPVNYIQDHQMVYVTSQKERTWWKNLRGGAEAVLRLRGQNLKAAGEVVEDEPGVTAQMATYLVKAPQYARHFGIALDAENKISLEDTTKAAINRVFIIFHLPG